jgi:muramidase (phage lysozyme)
MQKALTSALGRAPTTGELYLAHQQGITGATALLKNPDASALSVLTKVYGSADRAQAAITQNGGKTNMTAGQFAQKWTGYADMTVQAIKTATQTTQALPSSGVGSALPAPVPLGQKPAPQNTLAEIMGEFKQSVGDTKPLTQPPVPTPNNPVSYNSEDGVLGADKAPSQFNTTSHLAGDVQMPAGVKPAAATQMQTAMGTNNPNFTMLGNPAFQQQMSTQFPAYTPPVGPPPLNTTYNGNPAGIRVATVNPDGTDATLKSDSNDNNIKGAFLAQIHESVGSPTSNQLFGGNTADNASPNHPNQKVFYDDGKAYSTAAGTYQIPYATWQQYAGQLGGASFNNPEDQQKVAWAVAADNYKIQTGGRDLLSDLKSGNQDAIASAFVNSNNVWNTLPGGTNPTTDVNKVTNGYKAAVSSANYNSTDVSTATVNTLPAWQTAGQVGAFSDPNQKVTTSSGQTVTAAQKNAFAGTDTSKVNNQGSLSSASTAVKSGAGSIAAGVAASGGGSSKVYNEGSSSSPAPKSTGSVSNAGSVASGAGSFAGAPKTSSSSSSSSGTQKLQDIHDKLNK